MKLISKKCALTISWYVFYSLLFPVLLATYRSPSSTLIDNKHVNQNSELQETSVLNSENNVKVLRDVTETSSGDHLTTNTASENFLESLQEQCKKHRSILFVCNSLRLVLPVTHVQSAPLPVASEEIVQTKDANRQTHLENIKVQKRFTQPLGLTDIETYILKPEQHDETTVLPGIDHSNFNHRQKQGSFATNGDRENERIPRQPFEVSGPSRMLPDADDSNHKKPDMFSNMSNLNHDNSEDNDLMKTEKSKEIPYSESAEADIEDRYKSETPGIFNNMAYRNHMMTNSSEDNVFRKTDTADQDDYSEFMQAKAHINTDYDETEESEENRSFEMGEDDSKMHSVEEVDKLECEYENNCSVGDVSAENTSEIIAKEGDDGKSDDMEDRLSNDSVKIFKNSLTIKFPTFERVTNKIREWFKSVFGTKSRDEGKICVTEVNVL